MASDGRWPMCDDDESPELKHESLLPEADKLSEATACVDEDDQRLDSSPDPVSSSFNSHWSGSWSEPDEFCRNIQEHQFPLLPECDSSNNPAEELAEVNELSPSSSLSKNSTRAVTGAGLENLGNTCFLNSVLQCFIHTVPLIQPILSNEYLAQSRDNCNQEGFCLLCTLRHLIQRSLVSDTTSPRYLFNNLTHISSNFKKFQQEDAHEFLQCFLDKLERCHESESKRCMSSQSDNIVQQVFGGRLVSNLKCCNCGHCSDTYEPSIDLSLEIHDVDNLPAALHSFTKVEKIEDNENKFTCEKCNELVYVEKKLSFDQIPSVAVLHLKRFKNDGSFVEKIDKHVAFPLNLDLEPFIGNDKHNYSELQYVLYAVVVHSGLEPTSGHYYCFIRLSSDMWFKFDDSKVELVNEDYVLAQEAYILFYAKESTPWFSSFIETQKEIVNSSVWNTSPKSVLDDVEASSVSPNLEKPNGCNSNKASYDFVSANEGGNNNEIKDSEPVQKKNKGEAIVTGLKDSVAPVSRDSSNISLPKDKKVSPVLLEKVIHKQEASVLHNDQIDMERAFRSPSPEIYREDSPVAGFTISRSHLRSADHVPCKRRLVKEDNDDERKHARSFLMKNTPGSRRQQLMAALKGSQSEPSMNRKKTRRLIA